MTRPIETHPELWVTVKVAAAMRGRDVRTVRTWVAAGEVRAWKEPGGRVFVFLPDFTPPHELPARVPRGRRGVR
jgi:hypothetical protein